jgi:membrane-associated protease RseP (regulator of RpoE activity)
MSIHALVLAALLAQLPPTPPAHAPDHEKAGKAEKAEKALEASGQEARRKTPAPIAWRDAQEAQESSRPWLGVSLAGENQLEIADVQPNSPAAAADLQPGDRLLALDEDELDSFEALQGAMSAHQPGDSVQLAIARTVGVTLSDELRTEDGRPLLGVYLEENVITGVQEGHPAENAGLAEGDRIVEIDGEPTPDYEAIVERLRSADGGALEIQVEREVELELGARPDEVVFPRVQPFEMPAQPWGQGEGLFQFQAPEQHGLRDELRALSEEIASLREEIASLRAQIEALHPSQGMR